ncbi:MAG TPA: helix-turn-helix domain-containing protein [Acidimicrobiales bacterium]|nr:helix-turn-helix domain-containing protein [Acidimicrobiales bacterium]
MTDGHIANPESSWLSTKDAAARLGITLRSLYRFIDEGELTAYKFGRVIRLKEIDVEQFIEACRIKPGELEHLYPPLKGGDVAS